MDERSAVEADAPPRVKICGLTRNQDARRAEALGASYLGFILSDGFPRSVDREAAAAVVAGTTIARVAVVVDEGPDEAIRLAGRIDASVVQLHGDEDRRTVRAVQEGGGWTVWKAVRARTLDDVREVVDAVGDFVDGIVVEGWRRGVTGGGGVPVSLDPDAVRDAIPTDVTFVLAGGLEPGSVAHAVARFRPHVVDVSSGIERTVGVKSADLVAAFLRAVREAPRSG